MSDAPEAEPRFRRGSVLRGKYRVERVLGEGGMGVVLLATHLKLEQRVALKVLAPSVEQRAHVHARFAREARAVAKLRNEHVVRILDVDETEDGLPFLVMELLVGADLDALVRRDGPLSAERAADYVLQACEGIAEAHAVGIVHRDLKPANLFLAKTEDGTELVKVLDFGIAKAPASEDLALTGASGVVGSPLYMSPEQLKGTHEVDERTDIWSLGVVLHQLASGKLPFEATHATALAAVIASEPPAPLAQARSGLPATYVAIVERCLRKERAERFANVVELAGALAELVPGGAAAAERVARVSRAATARQLSLAATAPELDSDGGTSPEGSSSATPGRVTAPLTGDGDAPAPDPAAQRTDYGSEVAREASVAPRKRSRRLRIALPLVAIGAAAIAIAVRTREPPVRGDSRPEAPSATDALPVPPATISAAPASASAPPPAVTPSSSTTARASATPAVTGRLPHGAASARTNPSAAPSSSASPFDIDLK